MRLVLILLALALPVSAQTRGWQFYWENDIGVLTPGSDDQYTNGMRLTVGVRQTPNWAREFRTKYCKLPLSPCKRMKDTETESLAYGFTHQFYTPDDIEIAAPQPLDRPWAGYMYGSVNLQILDDTAEREQHVFELQVGILGQGAGAQFVQTEYHEVINSPRPQGWRHQLENEPVINLVYTQNKRLWNHADRADFIFSPGFAVGTLATYAGAGATVRVGYNISGFPAVPLAPTAAVAKRERPVWELYLHGGVDARAIAYNALLDGGFLRDGPSVDKSNGVYDLRGGFSVRRNNLRLTYNLVKRSEEFAPPPHVDSAPWFNSLVVAWEPER